MSQYPGTHNVNQYEVIDGQQRLSTFTLVANAILDKYKELKTLAEEQEDRDVSLRCETQINDLTPRFLQFNQVISDETTIVKTFRMSRRDNEFYSATIRGNSPEVQRESHGKIKYAYEKIVSSINEIIGEHENLSDISQSLNVLEQVLSTDFKILHLVTTNRQDAYQLFQVINDRGTSLTDADLLRCKVLELMENNGDEQNEAESIWDDIVSHEKTEEHLVWVYESKVGNKPKSGAVFDNYMDNYFKLGGTENINVGQLHNLMLDTRDIGSRIKLVRELLISEWPYDEMNPIEAWDRDRLEVLIEYLGNHAAIPLLVSARQLDHRKFSDIVQMLERFFYRYKIMCSGHNTQLNKIYARNAVRINADPENYVPESLRVELNELIDDKAPDHKFSGAIDDLLYNPRGVKKSLKHILLMVDQYMPWFENGAEGVPVCRDKTRIIDRKQGATIEHIYPKNLIETDSGWKAELEPIKNTLHNLVILSTAENTLVDTNEFEQKKKVFAQCSSNLTRRVASYDVWNEASANDHYEYIKRVALALFVA